MEEISLEFILNATGGRMSRACYNRKFHEVSTDTRRIAPGSLFIALKGARFDANDFLEEAFRKGAAACVAQRPSESGPVVLVPDSIRALHALAAAYRRRFDIPVVGVTGSVGKTSTKEMIHTVLSTRYRTLKNEGNRNNGIGMPLSVFSLDASYAAAVFEMGMSGFGEISALSRIARPSVGVITNIGVSHLEKLGTRDNILRAKLEIRDGMRPGSTLVLNADDERLRRVRPLPGEKIVTYGLTGQHSDIRADNIEVGEGGTSFRLSAKEGSVGVHLPVCGRHHVSNALAAVACARLLGVPAEESAAALADYRPAGLRERIVDFHGVRLIEDCYNASPDSMVSALSLLRTIRVTGRRVAVLADMLELGSVSRSSHRNVGAQAYDAGVDVLLAYGEQARGYCDGFRGRGPLGKRICRHFDDKEKLAAALARRMKPGDAVLFKASRAMKLEEVIHLSCERWHE